MSFVFYDTETTGINTSFDQILQFGAIRTDHDFKEIERFEIRCRLLPYIVPAPGAMKVTGVTVDQLTDQSLPSHYEMMREIERKLNDWSPAVFIGHNSIGFDEHLLRQALFKTLHAPYLTNTNGNCRSDSLRMIQAVAHLQPNTLTVPLNDKGRQSFKLDQLAPANGFDHRNAHDAMADVEATIHMCKLIAEQAPDHWSNFVQFAQKAAVISFLDEEGIFLLADFYYAKPYHWFVTSLGVNPEYNAEYFVFDLSVDPKDLVGMSAGDLETRLSKSPKPIRRLRANAAPILIEYDEAPTEFQLSAPSIDELQRRTEYLRANKEFCSTLIGAFLATREEKEPSVHVEEQIYDDFTSNEDRQILDQFHQVEWSARLALLGKLTDKRLLQFSQRLLLEEVPDIVDPEIREAYEVEIAERLMSSDENVPWLTLPKAIEQAKELLASASSSEKELLEDLQQYLIQWAENATAKLI